MENSSLPTVQVNDLELDYQGTSLPCPIQEGHHMIPVKTVCDIIDIKFSTQDSWLKDHPYFGQLYLLSGVVAADGKVRQMNCLPLFDMIAWLSSVTDRNRRDGSTEKQIAFMIWLRTQMLDLYKSINVYQAENKYEQELVSEKEKLEQELLNAKSSIKEIQSRLKLVEDTIEDIRVNRFTGQTALKFPEK